jgi:hypothetical protein
MIDTAEFSITSIRIYRAQGTRFLSLLKFRLLVVFGTQGFDEKLKDCLHGQAYEF